MLCVCVWGNDSTHAHTHSYTLHFWWENVVWKAIKDHTQFKMGHKIHLIVKRCSCCDCCLVVCISSALLFDSLLTPTSSWIRRSTSLTRRRLTGLTRYSADKGLQGFWRLLNYSKTQDSAFYFCFSHPEPCFTSWWPLNPFTTGASHNSRGIVTSEGMYFITTGETKEALMAQKSIIKIIRITIVYIAHFKILKVAPQG